MASRIWFDESSRANWTIEWTKADSIVFGQCRGSIQAEVFGRLVLQDEGRMKPVNTFSSELLRKLSGKNQYKGLNADQVFLSMTEFPLV